MTWASTLQYGSGALRFAIVIEGWPEIWVTDPSITLTHATYGARGRTVRTGLLRDGIEFSQRALLAQGKVDASGISFRVRSSDNREHALLSFARIGQQVAELGADLTAAATTITLNGGTLDEDVYYHIGTEVIQGEATPCYRRNGTMPKSPVLGMPVGAVSANRPFAGAGDKATSGSGGRVENPKIQARRCVALVSSKTRYSRGS